MALYRVGQPYNPRIPSFPEGLHILGLSAERAEVAVAFSGLTDEEVLGFRRGPFDVALAAVQELGVLLVRCAGSNGWMDVEYDLRRAPHSERTPVAGGHLLVTWFLLEPRGGIIRAMRQATLSPAFTAQLGALQRRQLARPFQPGRHAALVAEYQRQPAEALVRQAGIVESLGITEPPAAPVPDLLMSLRARYPRLDPQVHEVMAEALASGAAHIEQRSGVDWWVDPEFGPDVPVEALGYDGTLGLVDRRRFPRPGQA